MRRCEDHRCAETRTARTEPHTVSDPAPAEPLGRLPLKRIRTRTKPTGKRFVMCAVFATSMLHFDFGITTSIHLDPAKRTNLDTPPLWPADLTCGNVSTESKTLAARGMPVAVAFRWAGCSPLWSTRLAVVYKEGRYEEKRGSTTSAPFAYAPR